MELIPPMEALCLPFGWTDLTSSIRKDPLSRNQSCGIKGSGLPCDSPSLFSFGRPQGLEERRVAIGGEEIPSVGRSGCGPEIWAEGEGVGPTSERSGGRLRFQAVILDLAMYLIRSAESFVFLWMAAAASSRLSPSRIRLPISSIGSSSTM